MLASRVNHMLAGIGADVLADARHQRSEEICGADDEAQLHPGVEREADR